MSLSFSIGIKGSNLRGGKLLGLRGSGVAQVKPFPTLLTKKSNTKLVRKGFKKNGKLSTFCE